MQLKNLLLFLSIIPLTLIAACNSQSTEEQIHSHLEEAVALEADFEEQQGAITDLEIQEQEIYNQIIDLGMDDFDQITELSDQALEIIDEREEKIGIEKQSIEASQEEFAAVETLISDIEDPDVKEKAENMYDVMNNRYLAYSELNEAYMNSLELERELYTMLKQEDIEQEDLTAHINSINDSYEQVLNSNDQFNNHTVEYNALKKEFYDAAGLEVSYEE
ncbi:YkyA family protein [Oceanobacillus damuensis]|uniref:YkyA family protein n=1 Tax=Oceanobacillus damuensis TaxID=937928 RepID=UPI000833F10E|nr:YkyA family protein [Oceanobacillus damuensis]